LTGASRRLLGFGWNIVYLIGYTGAGNVGDTFSAYRELRDYKVDAGLGIESGLADRDYRALLGGLFAKTLVNGVGGFRFLLSLKTYR